jgi:hypothetical protein
VAVNLIGQEALKELSEALKDSLFQLTAVEEERALIEDIRSQLKVWCLLRRLWQRGESASKLLIAFCAASVRFRETPLASLEVSTVSSAC